MTIYDQIIEQSKQQGGLSNPPQPCPVRTDFASRFFAIVEDETRFVAKRKNTALARGNWTAAIECDAKTELLAALKKRMTEEST